VLAVEQQTWIGIAAALVPSLIALLAAIVGVLNRQALKTSGSKTVGQMVEEAHSEAASPPPPAGTN
jgi:biopolymer transport protein ExbB/TolQ